MVQGLAQEMTHKVCKVKANLVLATNGDVIVCIRPAVRSGAGQVAKPSYGCDQVDNGLHVAAALGALVVHTCTCIRGTRFLGVAPKFM